MSGSCPFCSGTDLAHTTKGKTICLDCENTWGEKAQRPPPLPAAPSDGQVARWVDDMARRG